MEQADKKANGKISTADELEFRIQKAHTFHGFARIQNLSTKSVSEFLG
jgi:hypothetical protein